MRNSKPLLLALATGIVLVLVVVLFLSRSRERVDVPSVAPTEPTRIAHESPAEPKGAVGASERTALQISTPTATSPSPSPSSANEPAVLQGRVVDEGRSPIEGVEVALVVRRAGGFAEMLEAEYTSEEIRIATTTTDALGAFRFAADAKRSYELHARKSGWSTTQIDDVGAGPPIDVVLRGGASLGLRVVRASDGTPVADARVVLMHDAIIANLETRTDPSGRARFTDLPPGAGWVQAIHAELAASGNDVEFVAGTDVELLLELADGHVVTGIVRERGTGRPIADAEVSSWDFYDKIVRTDAEGRYRIVGVDPGGVDSRAISARARGFGRSVRRVKLVTGVEATCDFELARGFAVRGRIVDSSGAPIAAAYVAATGAKEGTPRETERIPGRTRDDGRFELADLARDLPHALFVRAHGRETRTLEVPSPAADADAIDLADLVLAAGASIEGRVVASTQQPVADALLVVSHVEAARAAVDTHLATQQSRTDAHGRFRIADLAAGRHAIRVVSRGFTGLDTEIALAAGESKRDVELILPGGGALAGIVVDDVGAPVHDAEVHVSGMDSPRWIGRARTALDGSFRIEGLPDDALRIDAQRFDPIEVSGVETVWLLPSAQSEVRPWTTDLRIVLPKAGVIEGRILASDGSALVGGCVEAFDAEGRAVGQGAGREGSFRVLVPSGATVRLVGFRRTLTDAGRFERVPILGEEAVVENVRAGSRDVVVRFVKRP